MRLEELNALDAATVARELLQCCGSTRWAALMAGSRPFAGTAAMARAADRAFDVLEREDWLEAFAAHPRIGAGRAGGAGGAGRSERWSEREQARVAQAGDPTRQRLADANRDYEARFGYIFIVCATGKTAAEMLALLESRLGNDPGTELQIAANEQKKITHLRLVKLLDGDQDKNR
jgi:2-oxo-4-hydroxy-4-carboxy-5-ureidoimidazoline decarboxylase